MKRIIFLMSLLFTIKSAQAQPKTSNWATLQIPVSIDKHWQWLNEYSYRTMGESASLYQLFLRTGVRYVFNSKWNVASSFDLTFTRTSLQKSNHEYSNEKRPWQEINYNIPLSKKYSIQNRIRIEERFFSPAYSQGSYKSMRFRYKIGAGKQISEKWNVQLSTEFLESLESKEFSFNQNRIFLNTIHQLKHNAQFQAGYYFVIRPEGQMQHIIALAFQKKLSFHGRKNA